MIDEQEDYERAARTWVKATPERRKCSNEDCGHTLSQSNKNDICRGCQEKARALRIRELQSQAWPTGSGSTTVPAGCGRADGRRPVRKTSGGLWLN